MLTCLKLPNIKYPSKYDYTEAFYEAAGLTNNRMRYYSERRKESKYADVLIASCQHKDWWYADFIGMTVFVRLSIFKHDFNGKPYIYCARTVLVNNTRLLTGRDLDIKDIIIQ